MIIQQLPPLLWRSFSRFQRIDWLAAQTHRFSIRFLDARVATEPQRICGTECSRVGRVSALLPYHLDYWLDSYSPASQFVLPSGNYSVGSCC